MALSPGRLLPVRRRITLGAMEARAEVVVPCEDLDTALLFYVDRLGFRVEAILPADAPVVAVVSGYGVRLRLERGSAAPPPTLRLACEDPAPVGELQPPDGVRIELARADQPLVVPPLQPSFVATHLEGDAAWGEGRAGMQYRDLIPGRQGGRFIASHIRIPTGGPVPDYVHYHLVRFQMIYCAAGWVRVVYEDQGPPFVLHTGDCVLQPPRIRHRVLECSPGLEVVEVSCPAEHETRGDLELELPTPAVSPDRDFSGQRFVRHVAAGAAWRPAPLPGFDARDTGIAEATRGLASIEVLRRNDAPLEGERAHDGELLFWFVLSGTAILRVDGHPDTHLARGDAVVVPPGVPYGYREASPDLELFEATLPAPRFES